jgi:hypothetical protein
MKVYFNNSCKICKAEIDLYKKEKIQEIDWIDITGNEIAEKETSKNLYRFPFFLIYLPVPVFYPVFFATCSHPSLISLIAFNKSL